MTLSEFQCFCNAASVASVSVMVIDVLHVLHVLHEENVIEMNNGCICCTVRGDLIAGLKKLHKQTTGKAHPIQTRSAPSDFALFLES